MRARTTPPGGAVGLALTLSILASLGLIVTYWLGGQPQVEGALIGVSLGGIAVGLVVWAKRFLPGGGFVQEREPIGSTVAERAEFERDFETGEATMARRGFLKLLATALGALGIVALFPIRSLGPKPGRSLFRTSWRTGTRLVTPGGQPVTIAALQPGGVLTVFPEGHEDDDGSQAVLIRLDPLDFTALPGRETWTPDGYIAYSKICTHAGCPVGLYEAAAKELFCPCHQSVFDVLNGAQPTAGPATRPLPQLPLQVGQGGNLEAQSDYPEPVGPGFWNRP